MKCFHIVHPAPSTNFLRCAKVSNPLRDAEDNAIQLLFSAKTDSLDPCGYFYVCPAAKHAFVGVKIGFINLSAKRFKLVTSLSKMGVVTTVLT